MPVVLCPLCGPVILVAVGGMVKKIFNNPWIINSLSSIIQPCIDRHWMRMQRVTKSKRGWTQAHSLATCIMFLFALLLIKVIQYYSNCIIWYSTL